MHVLQPTLRQAIGIIDLSGNTAFLTQIGNIDICSIVDQSSLAIVTGLYVYVCSVLCDY